jgi:hypothetical protein
MLRNTPPISPEDLEKSEAEYHYNRESCASFMEMLREESRIHAPKLDARGCVINRNYNREPNGDWIDEI